MILPDGSELGPGIEPVVVTRNYYIGLERYDATTTYMHATVFGHWGPGLAREIKAAVDVVCAAHDGPVFAASPQPHGGNHAKFAKFTRLMGFTFFRTVRGTDGTDHAVFWRQ